MNFKLLVLMTLCLSVITSCGSSKSANKTEPVAAAQTQTPPRPSTDVGPQTSVPQPTGSVTTSQIQNAEPAAPIGKADTTQKEEAKKTTSREQKKNEIPNFNLEANIKTGGQANGAFYSSAADDGLMTMFKSISTSVNKEQQVLNLQLAQSIVRAKFINDTKSGVLEILMSEGGEAKAYIMSAQAVNSKMILTGVSSTGQNQFQGGFVKCLDQSCEESYAKVKFSGAYARIIFRTVYAQNRFGIVNNAVSADYKTWTQYILNAQQGANTDMRIQSVKLSSYEVLNGKSAMGVQLLTEDGEAVSMNMLLVTADRGSDVNVLTKVVKNLSTDYNLPSTASKKINLSNMISEAKLVNNNGMGQIKLNLKISESILSMMLFRDHKVLMSSGQVKEFEKSVEAF